jgi:hypothetical protein
MMQRKVAGRERLAMRCEAVPTISSTVVHSLIRRDAAGIEARGEEQVADESAEPARFLDEALEQLAPAIRIERVAGIEQGRRRALDRRQRRAQVVRHAAQERRAQSLGLGLDASDVACLGEIGAIERRGQQRRQRVEQEELRRRSGPREAYHDARPSFRSP